MDSPVCKQDHTSGSKEILDVDGFNVIAITIAKHSETALRPHRQVSELRCAKATSSIQQGTVEKVYQTRAVFVGGDLPLIAARIREGAYQPANEVPSAERALPPRCSTGKIVSLPLQ
jgi:hypothetical protein